MNKKKCGQDFPLSALCFSRADKGILGMYMHITHTHTNEKIRKKTHINIVWQIVPPKMPIKRKANVTVA